MPDGLVNFDAASLTIPVRADREEIDRDIGEIEAKFKGIGEDFGKALADAIEKASHDAHEQVDSFRESAIVAAVNGEHTPKWASTIIDLLERIARAVESDRTGMGG